MNDIKIIYDNGDFEYTRFNGTEHDIRSYYVGNSFVYYDAILCKECKRKVVDVVIYN